MSAASKKATIVVAAVCLMGCLALAACSSAGTDGGSESADATTVSYSEDSLIQLHADLGTDISDLTEVSVAACTNDSCHGGDFESVREATEDLWEGIGQIPDANPHEAHASAGFACDSCHSLTGTSVNVCNQCHDFDTPDGWVDKDSTTTIYGLVANEPLYGDDDADDDTEDADEEADEDVEDADEADEEADEAE